ncbi:hypothetical protein [Vineibacter terrae]|uniref:hypothetical protein n=1 Tax=Vineibacter terrae TaxID=2586908 RepID=UPI0015B72DAC|nr:hypothetical protein [Vineibacter terrae]
MKALALKLSFFPGRPCCRRGRYKRRRKVILVLDQISDSCAGCGDADHTAQQDFATEQT